MRNRLQTAVVVLLAFVLTGCGFQGVYDVPLPGGYVDEENSFEITADFSDALNVVPRTAVMVADVPVGQVVDVERVGWSARVTMWVRDDVELPEQTTAQIRQTSLLGEKFIELVEPTADGEEAVAATGRLGEGDVIDLDRTGLNPEVEDVLGALSMLLTGGGVGQLQTITQELNAMMSGRTDEMTSLLNRLDEFVGTLDTQRSDIIGALDSINGLSATLVAEKETIDSALGAVGPAVDVLRDQHDELVRLLSELDDLGTVGTRVVNATKDDLVAQLRSLEPVLHELADTGDSLVTGAVAVASYPFPIDAADAIKGDFANVIFSLQFKLTPVSEGGLIPTNLQELESLCKSLPTAPICSPLGEVFDQLCGLVGALPLCAQEEAADVAAALAQFEDQGAASGSGSGGTPAVPGLASPTDPGASPGSGAEPGWLSGLVGGLLR